MLRDRLARHRQLGRELGGRRRAALRERLEHEAPVRVGERREDVTRRQARARAARARGPNSGLDSRTRDARAAVDLLELELDRAAVVPAQREPALLVDLLDRAVQLLAVVPAEHAVAARPRVELDVVREPLLETVGLGQRLPDLLGSRPARTISRVTSMSNLLVAYMMGNRTVAR